MSLKLNLIAAMCENSGIGKNKDLPWRLKSEMAYFTSMTQSTKNETKKNVVIIGRNTWDCIPPKFKPLSDRINFVITRSDIDLQKFKNTYSDKSLDAVLERLQGEEFRDKFETVWVIGGSKIYELSMRHPYFYRLYLTKIYKEFDCDTFFPEIPKNLKEVKLSAVPEGIQKEKDIEFEYFVYENPEMTITE